MTNIQIVKELMMPENGGASGDTSMLISMTANRHAETAIRLFEIDLLAFLGFAKMF